VKRVREYIPNKVFNLTERQVAMAEALSQYPQDSRRTRPVVKLALETSMLLTNEQNITLYMMRDEVFELADYISNGWEYVLKTTGELTGIVWTQTLEKFCQEIVADPAANVRRACARANIDFMTGKELPKRKDIQNRIAEIREERKQRFELRADRVLEKVLMLSTASLQDVIERTDDNGNIVFKDFSTLSPDEVYPIQQITRTRNGTGKFTTTSYKIKLEDRGKNLALLMKHLGLLDGNSSDNPEETGAAIRKWASNVEDFVPGGSL